MSDLPEIIDDLRDFTLPAAFRQILEDLLRSVPPGFLVGLQCVILRNSQDLSRDERRKKTWGRKRQVLLADVLGYYSAATRTSSAFIVLHVDQIIREWTGFLSRLRIIRYMLVSDVLYHEIGHHIHAVHRREYKGKEDAAEYWRRKLSAGFVRNRYWYLTPLIVVVGRIGRLVKRIRA